MWPNPTETAKSITSTKEIPNGKHFIFCIAILSNKFPQILIKMMLFNLFRSEPECESDSRFRRNSFICKCEERDYLTIWNWDYLLRSCFLLKIIVTKLENGNLISYCCFCWIKKKVCRAVGKVFVSKYFLRLYRQTDIFLFILCKHKFLLIKENHSKSSVLFTIIHKIFKTNSIFHFK